MASAVAAENLLSPGTKHEEFMQWAKSQGIQINGVAPVRLQGRAVGIAALRNIDAGETIVSVPTSSLLTLDKIPLAFKEKFPADTPVQGVIAAYLTCDDEARSKYAPWLATWPTMDDFNNSMPLLWPEYIMGTSNKECGARCKTRAQEGGTFLSLSPPSISGCWNSLPNKYQAPVSYKPVNQHLFQRQKKRFQKTLSLVKQAFPLINQEEYTYHWLAAHTRCFFYVAKDAEVPQDRNDAMALCPFADYFNHSSDDAGCKAAFDENGYTFTTTKSYGKGEEIFVCYGNHTSDVLLVDYGFIPDKNKSDVIFLDDIVFQDFDSEKRRYLEEDNYLGNYQVAQSGPCFRTEAAASLTYMSPEDWRTYIAGGMPSSFDQKKTNGIIVSWIRQYLNEAKVAIGRVEAIVGGCGDDIHFGILLVRWRQILRLCQSALSSLESSEAR